MIRKWLKRLGLFLCGMDRRRHKRCLCGAWILAYRDGVPVISGWQTVWQLASNPKGLICVAEQRRHYCCETCGWHLCRDGVARPFGEYDEAYDKLSRTGGA